MIIKEDEIVSDIDPETKDVTLYDYETDTVIEPSVISDDTETEGPIKNGGESFQNNERTGDERNDIEQDERFDEDDIFSMLHETDTITRSIIEGPPETETKITETDDGLIVTECEGFDAEELDECIDIIEQENSATNELGTIEELSEIEEVIPEELTLDELSVFSEDLLEDETLEPLDQDLDLALLDEIDVEFDLKDEETSIPASDNSIQKQQENIKPVIKNENLTTTPHSEAKLKNNTLSKEEKESIENDIKADHSIVIVEKYKDIRDKLVNIWKYKHTQSHHTQNKAEIRKSRTKYYSTQPASRIRRSPYIKHIPSPGFTPEQKRSIEKDIAIPHSIVIEENIQDIHDRMIKMWDEYSSQFQDISDQVIVFNNDADVSRFINQFETMQEKEDMKKFLSFLKQMFQELPEELITKFVTSEYYTIYTKLLSEMEDPDNET